MAAITVADIVSGLKLRPEGMKMKFRSKSDESVKYKCLVKSVDKKEGKASVEVLEGPSEGKTLNVTLERLLRMQGRQVGASPASSKKAETSKPVTKVKETTKPAAKAGKAKAPKKADAEELNLKSAKSELLDIAELLRDLAIRSETLLNFLEGYQDNEDADETEEEEEDADETEEEEEEEEEEESPAPKTKAKRSRKPAMDEED